MVNKSKSIFTSMIVSLMLVLGACGTPAPKQSDSQIESEDSTSESIESLEPSESSESIESSEESVPLNKYTLTFVDRGQVIHVMNDVEEGSIVTYDGPIPVKEADENAYRYRFKEWVPSLRLPVTKDTTYVSTFSAYAEELMIDDFESYKNSASMIDEGWQALGYNSSTQKWTTETAASVSLGKKSVEGEKSLRFNAWENGVGYEFRKLLDTNHLDKSINALRFRLMAPSINECSVLMNLKPMTIEGRTLSPQFKYVLNLKTSEFVEYTLPLSDPNWLLWGESGKSIASVADWTGIHQDDICEYLDNITFFLKGSDGANGIPYAAFLDSIKFVTTVAPDYVENESMYDYTVYSGKLNNGYTLRLDIDSLENEGNATAKVIDLETPKTIYGKIHLQGNLISFVADDENQLVYNGRLVDGGQKIKFLSASGSLLEDVDGMNLVAVQTVENFEEYTEDGVAYYQDTEMSDRRGCRGAYYSEYYAGEGHSSPWGKNGWSLMGGDGDQLKLIQDAEGAHSGTNYLKLKNAKDNAMRYMQWGLFDGTSEKNSFRGSRMSFWAKTDGVVPAFKVSMYSQSSPTLQTKDQYVKSETFNETEEVNEWKHYEIELNPNYVYYGFMVFMEKTLTSTAYLYIDDIEIYGANPYAKFELPEPEPVPEVKQGFTYVGKYKNMFNITLDVGNNNSVTLKSNPLSIDNTGSLENIDGEAKITFGTLTYVATISEDLKTLTYKEILGGNQLTDYLTNLDFHMIDYADNAEQYDKDGLMYYQGNMSESAAKGARGAYYCDYWVGTGSGSGLSPLGGSGWCLMGGSGDQLQLDKTQAYDGSQSIKIKESTAGDMRYLQWHLYKGTGEGYTGVDGFSITLKNNGSIDVTMKILVYKVQKVTSATQSGDENLDMLEVVLPANQDWTTYTVPLDINETYYGYGLVAVKGTSIAWINADKAYYHGPLTDPNIYYSFGVNSSMIGPTAIEGKGCTFVFDTAGQLSLSFEGHDYSVKYQMSMSNDDKQVITMHIEEETLVGTIEIDSSSFVVTIKITSNSGGEITSNFPEGYQYVGSPIF